VFNTKTTTSDIPTVSGNDLTWVQVDTIERVVTVSRRITLFRAMSAVPIAGAVTIDWSGNTQTSKGYMIEEYTDLGSVNSADAVVQSKSANVSGNIATVTLDALVRTYKAATAIAFFVNGTGGITPRTAWTESMDIAVVTPQARAETQFLLDGGEDTGSATIGAAQTGVALMVEITAQGPQDYATWLTRGRRRNKR
jgi:hypothetical protein